jgi:hypothetical protein
VECGMMQGLLFPGIWRSANLGAIVYPYGHIYAFL